MKVGLFCSARADLDRAWIDDAARLGQFIGANRWTLVYGGVNMGLMKVAAEAVRAAGGRTVGVVPIRRRKAQDERNDVNIRVNNLEQRKETFSRLCDLFVVLPGGYGTLDELVSTLASINFNQTQKKIVILNSEGLFDPLREQFYRMIEHGLMEPAVLKALTFTGSIENLIEILKTYGEK